MGLDVVAYSQLEKIKDEPPKKENGNTDWNKINSNNQVWIEPHPDYPERADGMKGLYKPTTTDYHSFRAGSYSGYNHFRDWLAKYLVAWKLIQQPGIKEKIEYQPTGAYNQDNIASNIIWQNMEHFKKEPFHEIIAFPDNEGIIGSDTAQKLYQDFKQHEKTFHQMFIDKENYTEGIRRSYQDFKKAFKLASENGVVKYR